MQVRFLLGPAGSGKTRRCLSEIREELARDPLGPPLILVAPKQATFQLERQLLSAPDLHGYTRLQILSFDRLADYVLEQLSVESAELLSEEGRVMVLRALLAGRQSELAMYHASAHLPGFAQQLGLFLREMRRSQVSPARLERLAENAELPVGLGRKLRDVALIAGAYRDWMESHDLQDVDEALDLATHELRRLEIPSRLDRHQPPPIFLSGLWLDGFAEMTEQETELLAAMLPFCEQATLAFCLADGTGTGEGAFSIWSTVEGSYRRCRERIEAIKGCELVVEELPRVSGSSRFRESPALAALEAHWATGEPAPVTDSGEVRMIACQNREAEAVHAARVIRRHVREGGRYRDATVLVRSLDDYGRVLRRVFTRYGIPFFLDQRESAAHHPLAEFTRLALRTVAWNWQAEDWFGLLKTGLCGVGDSLIDWIENVALARGWDGQDWMGMPAREGEDRLAEALEELRAKVTLRVRRFGETLGVENGDTLTGGQLARAVRGLWDEFRVGSRLESWSEARWPGAESRIYFHEPSVVHRTVWEQMVRWLENVEQAFPEDAPPLSVRDWLPIIEAGLSNLSVGVIPPATDQVLVGAVDRTRNPEVAITLVLGLNEGVFPAPPPAPPLLTDPERALLADHRTGIGPGWRQLLAQERYLGYIACTRPGRELHLTWALADDSGRPLTWSSLVDHVARILGRKEHERFLPPVASVEAEHHSEIVSELIAGDLGALSDLPSVRPIAEAWSRWQAIGRESTLPGDLVAARFGMPWLSSVSALETFAQCPFRFFVRHFLKARERDVSEPDVRERGTFQHDLLEEFHRRAVVQGGWRSLSPTEGENLIHEIANDILSVSAGGKFARDAGTRFAAGEMAGEVGRLVHAMLEWLGESYGFTPKAAEIAFGPGEDCDFPGLAVPLADGRELLLQGRIDRLDLKPSASDPTTALATIIDYKSSDRDLEDDLIWNGLQLQLLAYLHVVSELPELAAGFGFHRLDPVGAFYVALKWHGTASAARDEEAGDRARKGYYHQGRLNQNFLKDFDSTRGSGQFKLNRSKTPMPESRFNRFRYRVIECLQEFGDRILGGEIAANPYRHKAKTPCDHCESAAICRFDSWQTDYRSLVPSPEAE